MDAWKKRWGFEQWTAYFETQTLPVTPKSKVMLLDLEAAKGELLSPKELLAIVLSDPLLCLRVLREAEKMRSHRLGHETTTALGAILQLGVEHFRKLLLESGEIDESNAGLMEVEARSALAARIALNWAGAHSDINPEEVAVAALLADAGELLIWVYAPELAQAAEDELASGRATRSSRAQAQACGFDFKSVTVRCSELWHLPDLLRLLLRGSETLRAQLAILCSNAARHIIEQSPTSDMAIASDLAAAKKLIPSASLHWLIEGLIFVPPEKHAEIIAAAENLVPATD